MCGIVGYITKNPALTLSENLPAAVEKLRHRGPDDGEFLVSAEYGLGLGHRRLSILDLSERGRQPLPSACGHAVIVYNGEVYNFRKLRRELVERGYRFNSQTDTEVIVNAYLEWGPGCLKRFAGMFALAIWDYRKRLLFIARDRLGIKPLYYATGKDTFFFASELKAIAAFEAFPHELNDAALPLYLHYQYIPGPQTILKNAFKLLPGHYAIVKDNALSVTSYWDLPGAAAKIPEDKVDTAEIVSSLTSRLSEAVSDRLISDVPLGALLSGGIDSSTVVALMQANQTRPVKTFSIGFQDRARDESSWAARIARHLGTEHTRLVLTPEMTFDTIPSLPELYDEPFADASAIPTFLVSRLTREHVTVALSGDGGDELFGGYARYWGAADLSRHLRRLPVWSTDAFLLLMGKLSPQWIDNAYHGIRRFLPKRFQLANVAEKWQKLLCSLKERDPLSIYRNMACIWSVDDVQHLCGQGISWGAFETAFDRAEGLPPIEKFMRVDQNTYLPDGMLTKVDRASMANGLEVRVPLLDHRVVEFVSALPLSIICRGKNPKFLLKQVLKQFVPEALFERPKMGFAIPLSTWLRGPLREMLRDYLSEDRLKREGVFDHRFIGLIVDQHLLAHQDHPHRLWALLMWEMWRERWMPF